jgi:hypothetical protein
MNEEGHVAAMVPRVAPPDSTTKYAVKEEYLTHVPQPYNETVAEEEAEAFQKKRDEYTYSLKPLSWTDKRDACRSYGQILVCSLVSVCRNCA